MILYNIILLQTGYIGHICCTLGSYRTNRPKEEQKDGEVDERFWEILLSADKKDYERICAEYGVTDFRWMLKKLNEKKRELEEQQAQVKCQATHSSISIYKETVFKQNDLRFYETFIFLFLEI